MSRAEAPKNTNCPSCGTKPTEEQIDRAIVHERLTDVGYNHGDFKFNCQECGEEWVCGVPAGNSDALGDDLWCGSCDAGQFRVHRVVVDGAWFDPNTEVGLHLKCDNHGEWTCPECTREHTAIGYRRDGTPFCPSCDTDLDRDDLPGCFHFRKTTREKDNGGVALVGFPQITGEISDDTRPYGWRDNPAKND